MHSTAILPLVLATTATAHYSARGEATLHERGLDHADAYGDSIYKRETEALDAELYRREFFDDEEGLYARDAEAYDDNDVAGLYARDAEADEDDDLAGLFNRDADADADAEAEADEDDDLATLYARALETGDDDDLSMLYARAVAGEDDDELASLYTRSAQEAAIAEAAVKGGEAAVQKVEGAAHATKTKGGWFSRWGKKKEAKPQDPNAAAAANGGMGDWKQQLMWNLPMLGSMGMGGGGSSSSGGGGKDKGKEGKGAQPPPPPKKQGTPPGNQPQGNQPHKRDLEELEHYLATRDANPYAEAYAGADPEALLGDDAELERRADLYARAMFSHGRGNGWYSKLEKMLQQLQSDFEHDQKHDKDANHGRLPNKKQLERYHHIAFVLTNGGLGKESAHQVKKIMKDGGSISSGASSSGSMGGMSKHGSMKHHGGGDAQGGDMGGSGGMPGGGDGGMGGSGGIMSGSGGMGSAGGLSRRSLYSSPSSSLYARWAADQAAAGGDASANAGGASGTSGAGGTGGAGGADGSGGAGGAGGAGGSGGAGEPSASSGSNSSSGSTGAGGAGDPSGSSGDGSIGSLSAYDLARADWAAKTFMEIEEKGEAPSPDMLSQYPNLQKLAMQVQESRSEEHPNGSSGSGDASSGSGATSGDAGQSAEAPAGAAGATSEEDPHQAAHKMEKQLDGESGASGAPARKKASGSAVNGAKSGPSRRDLYARHADATARAQFWRRMLDEALASRSAEPEAFPEAYPGADPEAEAEVEFEEEYY